MKYTPTRTSYNARYTFSAKEKDTETGYSYFGARYYSSGLSIWLSVDPLADKYPSMSPYTYCANNPVKLVDPNGEEIVIEGADGKHTFTPGAECSSTDAKVQKAWQNLNGMYATEAGKSVIDEMSAEGSQTFTLTDASLYSDNTGRFKKDGTGGGTLFMGGNLDKAEYVAHELFHGYQEMKGQGGCSIHNEVEANLFSMMTTNNNLPLSPKNYDMKTDYGQSFADFKLNKVNKDNFLQHFNALCRGFKSQSVENKSGLYTNFKMGTENTSLLSKFFH